MSTALKLNASEFLAESPVMDSPPVRALINSVLAGDINFNGLERELFKILRESFVKVLVAVLEKIDDMLMYSAKRSGWEVHDRHECEIEEFKSLLNSVWEGITDWRERNRPVPENARGLGVIESNVGHTIARRFKHQGASWSPQGAVNLAKVRCAVRNSNLIELMRLSGPPPVEKSSEVTKTEITKLLVEKSFFK
ncbi:hypothetical protein Tfer_3130 [Thermincola ferriacetica]|uniref:Uncharacterized protein n=1 Tax=Thermincola ferriacetica TaxID=281456 RepID=A0A0L6VZN8_9FIRM|nr:UPF0236 family protein [Thermincola ferriacetica]KNZ68304.1 hypothetical protein Tfer_3130 [Thermincola ferriacetica]